MIERQESLPGLSEVELLESMGPDGIIDHILKLGEKATEIEKRMNLASEVLEGAYGVTVDTILRKRDTTLVALRGENQNEEQ